MTKTEFCRTSNLNSSSVATCFICPSTLGFSYDPGAYTFQGVRLNHRRPSCACVRTKAQ